MFGAIILIVLWVFQLFFVKPLYTMSKSRNVQLGMNRISLAVETNKNVWPTIENVAGHYSLSVYLYESGQGAPHDPLVCSYDNPATQLNLEYSDVLHFYEASIDNGGSYR